MTQIQPSARRKRNQEKLQRLVWAPSLTPAAITAFDAENDAKEVAAEAIAKARVTSEIELLMRSDDGDD